MQSQKILERKKEKKAAVFCNNQKKRQSWMDCWASVTWLRAVHEEVFQVVASISGFFLDS